MFSRNMEERTWGRNAGVGETWGLGMGRGCQEPHLSGFVADGDLVNLVQSSGVEWETG